MTPRLDWRIDDPDPPDVPFEPPRPTAPRPVRHRGALAWLALYVAAVALAGVAGFAIGRTSQARATEVRGLENQLDIERLAFREGDAGLLESTLDPQANPEWRFAVLADMAGMASRGPATYDVQLVSRERLAPDLIRVTLEISGPEGPGLETRRYRLLRGSWLRTPGR